MVSFSPHEQTRLDALHRFAIFQTPPEKEFDELVTLAAQVCGCSMAMMSFVDQEQIGVKAITGVPRHSNASFSQLPGAIALCRAVIDQPDALFTIADIQADPRFTLPQSEPTPFQFFAAVPLVTPDGWAIGVLSVMETMPKTLPLAQQNALQTLGRQAMTLLDYRRQQQQGDRHSPEFPQTQTQTKFEEFFHLSLDLLCVADLEGHFQQLNPAFEQTLGYTTAELLQKPYIEFVHPEDREATLEQAALIARGLMAVQFSNRYRCKDGSYRWLSWSSVPNLEQGLIYAVARDVTLQKQMEVALKESEERWQLALKGNNDGIWDWNVQTNEVFFSSRWKEMLGYTDPEIENRLEEWSSRVHPDDLEWVMAKIQEHFAGQTPFYVSEHRVRCKDGTYKWILDRGQVLRDEAGNGVRMTGSHTDITERKHLEATLRRQALIFENLYDGVIVTDLAGKVTDWNPGAEKMFGYSKAEMLGQSLERLYPLSPESSPPYPQQFGASDVRFRRQDGQEGVAETTVVPLLDEQGAILSTVYVNHDITQRKRDEEILRQRNRRSRVFAAITLKIRQSLDIREILHTSVTEVKDLLQADRVLIFRLHSTGIGQVIEEAIAPGVSSVLHIEVRDNCFGESYLHQYRQGRVYLLNIADSATVEPCLLDFMEQIGVQSKLVMPIVVQDLFWGLLIAHQCSYPRQWLSEEIDIMRQLADQMGIALTQAHFLEQSTQRSEELARSNADLEEFAYVASHDLQEPLRTVTGYLQLFQKRYSHRLDSDGLEFINFAMEGVTRMRTLIQDLLIYSRVGTRARFPERISVQDSLQQALASLQTLIEERGAIVTHAPLPIVWADKTQLTQLFQNLIGNGIKFCREIPPRLHINVTLRPLPAPHAPEGFSPRLVLDRAQISPEEWLFSVADNGIGIDPQHFATIFMPFQRLHNRTEYPGTGIGLAVCKKIVDRHGGTLWVESQPGEGSTFYFTLPANPARSLEPTFLRGQEELV